jgi:hypothetical protein
MSSVTLTKGDEPATPPAGRIIIYADSTTGLLYMKKDDGTTAPVVGQKDPELKSITIENPSSAEDISFFFTNAALTITEIRAVIVGSSTPSITWTLRHGIDRSAAGSEVITGGTATTSDSSGNDITTFDDPTVVADSFIWVETTAKSGIVESLMLTVFYTED